MRIVFVVNNYPPRVGGVENHVSNLARNLAAQSHDVTVHTLSDTLRGESVEEGVVVHRWPELLRVGGLLGFPTLPAALGIWRATRGADVVSVHTRFFPLTWLGTAAGRRAGIPVVHTEHGSDFVASPSRIIRVCSRLVDRTLGRWSLRAADLVVGVSSEVVAFVERLAGVRARVFHNAIDLPSGQRDATRRRHLVFVGRVVPGKGWEDFLAVVAALGAEVTADVLGEGSDLPALRRRAAELGLGERVAIRGRVPLEEVYSALAGSVLVNPTRLSEGFQTTLLEALAVGARIVTYAVPGTALLAEQGAPVTVVERTVAALADGVRAALSDEAPAWGTDEIRPWTWPVRSREFARLVADIAGHEVG